MSDVSISTVLLVSFMTGLVGSGLGTPFGQWLFKKYLEPNLEKAHEKVKKGEVPLPKIPSNERIAEMLGRGKE